MNEAQGYIAGDKLLLSVKNLNELYKLIDTAQTQLQSLNATLSRLKIYDLEIKISQE